MLHPAVPIIALPIRCLTQLRQRHGGLLEIGQSFRRSTPGAEVMVKRFGLRVGITSRQASGMETVAPDRALGDQAATAVAPRSFLR